MKCCTRFACTDFERCKFFRFSLNQVGQLKKQKNTKKQIYTIVVMLEFLPNKTEIPRSLTNSTLFSLQSLINQHFNIFQSNSMSSNKFSNLQVCTQSHKHSKHNLASASFALLFVQNYAMLDLGDKISSGVWWIPKCCFFTALKSDKCS